MIDLQLLGTLDLRGEHGEEVLSVLSQPKRTALLVYLAVAGSEGFLRRDTLLGLFWPESTQERGRGALRKAIHHLRRSLGKGVVRSRGDEELGLDWQLIQCDVRRFEAAVTKGDDPGALHLYRGDLLDGFFLPDCPGFEEWLSRERGRLREAASQVAWNVAHQKLAGGEINEAERTGRAALDLLPSDESEVRRFALALAGKGERAGAVRLIEALLVYLRDDLGLDPSGETVSVLEEIRSSDGPSSTHSAESLPTASGTEYALPPADQPGPLSASPHPQVAESLTQRLRKRHMVEWGASFVAAAWAFIALAGLLERQFGLPEAAVQISTIIAVFGCFLAMILAWYHGENRQKRVTGPELVMIALLLCILALTISMVG